MFMRKYILFLTVPLLVCSAVSSAMPKINGSVCRTNPSADWYHGSGVYELATESGGTFTKISVSQSSISTDYGAVTVGNVFYAFSANETPWFSNYIIEAFSMDTFDRIPMTTADIGKTSVASALVYDDSTGKTYGCFFKSSSGFQFGTIDLPELPDLGGEGQMRIGEDGQIMDPADTAEITGADTPETAGAMEEEAP